MLHILYNLLPALTAGAVAGALTALYCLREGRLLSNGFQELLGMATERGLGVALVCEGAIEGQDIVADSIRGLNIFNHERNILTLAIHPKKHGMKLEHGPRLERKTVSHPMRHWRRTFTEIKSVIRPFPIVNSERV